ncbi:MAG: C4-dicarboxylate ABC transporter substrate-binding protein, partial [Pseudooceanicola nanhaiensis]
TGQVEAMITSPSTGANSKAWDFLSHYTPINAWVPKNIVVVNSRVFDGLDESVQQAVLDAAAKAEARGLEMSKAETEAKVAELEENGITVYEPSEELVAGLKEIGDKMLENWKSTASDDAKGALDAFQQ